MTVSLPPRAATGSSLRKLAERMDDLKGYYVEIIGGSLVVSPTPTVKHNGIVRRIARQFEDQLPDDRVPEQVTSVEPKDDDEDYTTPDLVVVPARVEHEDEWLLCADLVDFALEVVSKHNWATDTEVKPGEYARWGIPVFLLIDPRDGTMVLHFDPSEGGYREQRKMRFGETVTLPEPLGGMRIETNDFPLYD